MTKYKSNIEYDVFYWYGKNKEELTQWLEGISSDIVYYSVYRPFWRPEGTLPWIKLTDEKCGTEPVWELELGECCYLVFNVRLTHMGQYTVEEFKQLFTPITDTPV